jgi:hypothetical protein
VQDGQPPGRASPPPVGGQEFDEVGRGYWNCPGLDHVGSSSDTDVEDPHEFREPSTKAEANLLSSLCADGLHRPVLDIDIPAHFVPSSTPGHAHLYIDQGMTWERYEKLLRALDEAGVLEPGYVNAALTRKATFVRPEWVRKA